MNDNLKQIKKLWSAFASYYQKALSDAQVAMYAEDCSEYDASYVGKAMLAWRRNPKHTAMPLPGQLLAIIEGGNSRGNAASIALSLIGAVKRHDYTWPMRSSPKFYKTGSFKGDFIEELGDVAWEVVRLSGGWAIFCDSFWEGNNETAFRAQIRDAIECVIEKKRNGFLEAPKLVEISSPEQQQAIESLARLIGGPSAASGEWES